MIPEKLQTERFLRVWAEWLDHLAERGRPLTRAGGRSQLADLERDGPEAAVERLQISLQRNYRAPAELRGDQGVQGPEINPVGTVLAELGRIKRKAGR